MTNIAQADVVQVRRRIIITLIWIDVFQLILTENVA